MPDERVERLLAKAERAADEGEVDKAEAYLEILHPAIYLRNREVKELRRQFSEGSRGRHVR